MLRAWNTENNRFGERHSLQTVLKLWRTNERYERERNTNQAKEPGKKANVSQAQSEWARASKREKILDCNRRKESMWNSIKRRDELEIEAFMNIFLNWNFFFVCIYIMGLYIAFYLCFGIFSPYLFIIFFLCSFCYICYRFIMLFWNFLSIWSGIKANRVCVLKIWISAKQ